ncbi:hypothetical protein GIB67_006485, partial [Kingdonia uniflora]
MYKRLIQTRCCRSKAFDNENTALPGNQSFTSLILLKLIAVYKFCRFLPILLGTGSAVLSMSLLPIEMISDLSPAYIVAVLKAVIAMVLSNIFVSGINSLYDIEIDKINKPHSVLASGELSLSAGVAITTLSAIT